MKTFSRLFFLLSLIVSLACSTSVFSATEKKAEEKGVRVDREEGYVNLLVEEGNFELHFFDEEEKRIEPDAIRAVIHYTSRTVRNRETLTLLPVKEEEKVFLTSPRGLRPPYQYQVLLVLVLDSQGTKTESYSLLFQQAGEENTED